MMRVFFLAALTIFLGGIAHADTLRLAVTTTFRNAGLADILLPAIQKELDLNIDLIVVGTGQAIGLAKAGDVDAILVHARAAETALVAAGIATHRREIMHNDFVLVGPISDPAKVLNAENAAAAFQKIAAMNALFVSRGDDSGTHLRERELWRVAGISETDRPVDWYKAVGAGMGTALNIAAGLNAYVLSDRASWLTFRNKGDLALLYSGDPALFNQYSYLPISPDAHPFVKYDLALELETWLTSETARDLINGYRLNGAVLFTFNAAP